jgi:hypothetical protein
MVVLTSGAKRAGGSIFSHRISGHFVRFVDFNSLKSAFSHRPEMTIHRIEPRVSGGQTHRERGKNLMTWGDYMSDQPATRFGGKICTREGLEAQGALKKCHPTKVDGFCFLRPKVDQAYPTNP